MNFIPFENIVRLVARRALMYSNCCYQCDRTCKNILNFIYLHNNKFMYIFVTFFLSFLIQLYLSLLTLYTYSWTVIVSFVAVVQCSLYWQTNWLWREQKIKWDRERERRDCVHKTEAHITVNHSRSDNFIFVYAMMCLLSHFGALQRAQR